VTSKPIPPQKQIKAIIFDWGGVLIDDLAPGLIAYFAKALGVPEDALVNAYIRFVAEFQKGMMSERTLWERLCAELGVARLYNPTLWRDAVSSVCSPKHEMFFLAARLRDSGYHVGVLSNAEIAVMEYFYEQAYDVFDVTVFSCAEGTRKPEQKIYETVLERLQVQPSEVIFIDDKEINITAAEELGIHGIVFTSPEQVTKALVALSIDTAYALPSVS
jgi:putative hydrolase of the HAD superfamily